MSFAMFAHCTPKPFLKWAGGKGQLLPMIEQALPFEIGNEEKSFDASSRTTYVEPFVGGGAVLFRILSKFKIRQAVINDITPGLTTAYRVVRDAVRPLIECLTDIQEDYFTLANEDRCREFYLAARNRYNTCPLGEVEQAALFIFLNRTCFNGLHRVNSNGAFNVPFGRHVRPTICDVETLWADSKALQNVEILTGDFSQTLRYASNLSIFYLDPPYKPLSQTSSFNAYAKEAFGDGAQIRLKTFCDQLHAAGAAWILSNSDVRSNDISNTFFDDLYADYRIERVWASRSVNANPTKRGLLTELLIRNT